MSEREPRAGALRGRLVEGVRLIFIALFGHRRLPGRRVLRRGEHQQGPDVHLPGGRLRLRGRRRDGPAHAAGRRRHGARAPAQARPAAGRRRRRPRGRPGRRGPADDPAPVRPALASPGRRSCSSTSCWGRSGSASARPSYEDIFAPGRHEAAGVGGVGARRPARDRHERPDRRPGRRPRGHRVRQRHDPAARRRAARAPGDQRLLRPTSPNARPPRTRRPRRAPEGADRAVPAGRGGTA